MLTLKNQFHALKHLAAAGALLMLGACATSSNGRFSCPAPDGFSCMNPVEVYEATNVLPSADEGLRDKKGGKKAPPHSIMFQPATPAVAAPVAVGPDRCCDPVLTGLTVGKNDSLSLARPTSAIVPSQQQADALNRGTRTAVQAPAGDAYRESAKIMRIYIAPWEDEQGDLHMGGIIYSEIEPRKWRIGQRMPDASNTFALLKGQAAAADDEVASNEPGTGTTSNNFNPQR